jgi:thiaminase/transcriptional activator TenA
MFNAANRFRYRPIGPTEEGIVSFSHDLRQQADSIFDAILHHPFVRGIATATLTREQLAHYVQQDFQYLTVFCQIYALAIAKATTREDMSLFHQRIGYVLHSETHPHHNFAEVAGYELEELMHGTLLPTSRNYTRHMLHVAYSGSLGEILAALLPCPWTYWEIGVQLKEEVTPNPAHPFQPWIDFYAGSETTQQLVQRLDRWAEEANADERARMADHFLTSCRMEYLFWEMAYNLEAWPV